MQRPILLLIVSTFAATVSGRAQQSQSILNTSSGNNAASTVNVTSGIRRPTPAPTAAAAQAVSGPKKPLQALLTKEDKGKAPVSSFASSTPKIYLEWNDESATKGEKLRVVWIAEDAAAFAGKNKKLSEDTTTLPGAGAYGQFYLSSPAGGFPVGKYRADLYEDTKVSKSLKFTVTK